ncbi:hypothetical protein KW787_03800 [Candidatus Pacearchaeota archaeon]|nr:hypothetical protein [Candidatus Pacearchaeota archaeon]
MDYSLVQTVKITQSYAALVSFENTLRHSANRPAVIMDFAKVREDVIRYVEAIPPEVAEELPIPVGILEESILDELGKLENR